MNKKTYPTKTCPVCGKAFESKFKTCSRKCGWSQNKSPYEERGKSKTWLDDTNVEPALVVVPEQLAAFDAMPRPKTPPRRREPERSDAARVAASKDTCGVA
jgi:predicted nucleic acid-binding Zn ribbon protein